MRLSSQINTEMSARIPQTARIKHSDYHNRPNPPAVHDPSLARTFADYFPWQAHTGEKPGSAFQERAAPPGPDPKPLIPDN
jgi:hypothetical protein